MVVQHDYLPGNICKGRQDTYKKTPKKEEIKKEKREEKRKKKKGRKKNPIVLKDAKYALLKLCTPMTWIAERSLTPCFWTGIIVENTNVNEKLR